MSKGQHVCHCMYLLLMLDLMYDTLAQYANKWNDSVKIDKDKEKKKKITKSTSEKTVTDDEKGTK